MGIVLWPTCGSFGTGELLMLLGTGGHAFTGGHGLRVGTWVQVEQWDSGQSDQPLH